VTLLFHLKRRDFQELAAVRLNEARILLHRGCWDGAYYIGGYAAECALKACIAKLTERHSFPNKKKTDGSYTHDLMALMKTAELDDKLKAAEKGQPDFAANWRAVRNWTVDSRYERHSQTDAEALLDALLDRRSGVIRWLKQHW
jgi:HEPN domain-containing protein